MQNNSLKNQKFLLGVDAGGSKCEFLLTDLNKKPIIEYVIDKSCNLKYVPAKEVNNILKEGFEYIFKDYKVEDIAFAYFGIAECGKGIGTEQETINNFLKGYFENKFELADDQYSCFRSLSPSKNGVLAIAGTGSAVSFFKDGDEQVFKSIGHGGRDFGRKILTALRYGNIKPESRIYKLLKKEYKQDPKEFFENLKGREIITHPYITKVPKVLMSEYPSDPELKKEVDLYLNIAAARWAIKLSSYAFTHFGYSEESNFDLVLIGSFWKAAYMKEQMEQEVKRCFPNVKVHFSEDIQPVMGCVQIALEKFSE